MLLILKNTKDIGTIKEFLKNRAAYGAVHKAFDAKKFIGVLKVSKDALVIQKRLRNEWN